MDFVECTRDLNPEDLLAKSASYHKSCYADIANTTKIERAKKPYRDCTESSQPSVVTRKAGRPSSSTTKMEKDKPLTTRSKVKFFDRKLCIICQTAGARILTRVEFKETGIRMLKVLEKLVDKSFFRRVNSITNKEDAVANEVVYHDVCWVKAKLEAQPKPLKVENFVETLSDIELVSCLELKFLLQKDYVMTMNDVNKIYKKKLLENGVKENELLSSYKKCLKKLLQENLPNFVVVKSTQRNLS